MRFAHTTAVVSAFTLAMSAGQVGCQSSRPAMGVTHAGAEYADPTWGGGSLPAPARASGRTYGIEEPAPPLPATGLALPTGQRETSTILLEKFTPREVMAKQPFDYDIKVTNLTDLGLDNVVVSDTLPAGFRIGESQPRAQTGAVGDGPTTWALGSLGPRESKTIHIIGSGSGPGTLNSCATATYTTALCSSINVVQPTLRLTKVAPAESLLCDPIPIRLTVANTGTGTARNVRITDTLPPGMKTAEGKPVAEFVLASLGAGQSKEFAFTARAEKTGGYVNGAQAAADGGLQARSSEINTRVTQPVLVVTNRAPERVFVGRPVTFEITVTNTGDAAAADAVLENPLPAGATFVSATQDGRAANGRVTWALGRLEPRASRTVALTVDAPAIGEVRDTATATAVCAAAASATAGTAMAGIPALLLDGFDAPDPVEVGSQVVYTLNITNQGSAPLTNVRLVCTMDEGDHMAFVASSGAGAGKAAGRTISFPVIATLDAKARATYTVTIRAAGEGQAQLKAEVTSDQITRPLVKVETTNFYK